MPIRTKSVADAVLIHGREIVYPPHKLAKAFCTGFGLELGSAAHNTFDLPGSVNGAPEEYNPVYVQSQVQLCGRYDLVDEFCDGHRIPFPPASLDYCISSHVVEHFPDPIAHFLE